MYTSFEIVGKCCGTIAAKVNTVYYSSSVYFTVVFTKADKGLFTWRKILHQEHRHMSSIFSLHKKVGINLGF